MKIKDFVEKLQNLPVHQKKIILFSIVVILGLIMGYFWFNSTVKRISAIGEAIKSTTLPSINFPEMPSLDLSGVTTPSNQTATNIIETTTPSNEDINK